MNITLELLSGVAVVKNKGVIPLTADPLTVSVYSKDYVRDHLFLTASINNHTESFELTDGITVLPDRFATAGALKLTVRKIINGEVLRVWHAEEVLIKQIEGEYEAIPQVTELSNKVTALTAAVAELKQKIIEMGDF